jgi:hypothetical protein
MFTAERRRAALLCLSVALGFGTLATAARADDRHRDDRHDDRRDDHRDVRGGPGYYAPPPVVYGGPGYPPPPVVYGPGVGINLPGVSINLR